MDETGWDALREELTRRLAQLADGEFVILRHPFPAATDRDAEAAGGFLSRMRRPRVVEPETYVQVLHMGDELRAEAHLDGPDQDPAAAETQLRTDGWTSPADLPPHDAGENWVRFTALDTPDALTSVAAASVAVLEAAGLDPASGAWEWSGS